MNEISNRNESELSRFVLIPIILPRFACRVQFERLGVVCIMRETRTRGEWVTGSGVLTFTLFGSAGMEWSPVTCGFRGDWEQAGNQALEWTNDRNLTGWDGEQGLGLVSQGRGFVIVIFTSLQVLEWYRKDGSQEGEENDGSKCLHVGVWVRGKSNA